MVAKATDKADGAKTRTAKKPAAAATQKGGASAPSSAGAAKTPTPNAAAAASAAPGATDSAEKSVLDPAAPPAPAAIVSVQLIEDGAGLGPMGMGMGRFPPDWAPPPKVEPDEAAESVQTPPLEDSGEAGKFEVWGMPEITEFPATLKLRNASPARVRVLALKVWVLPGSEQTVQCLSPEQYSWLQRDLSARARSCKWDTTYGLQVTHEQN